MLPSLSFVIIDSDRNSRNAIEEVLRSFGDVKIHGSVTDFQDGLKIVQKSLPDVVILEARDLEKGIEELKYLLSKFHDVTVFITAQENNPDWILKLIRAGAGEYLTKPIVAAELEDAVNKIARLHNQKNEQTHKKGTVISLYNPAGGMGTTTIAVNLAATLAARGEKVLLVDLNLCCGDITAFLDLAPRYTLSSITTKRGHVDANFLRSVIVTHSSGVHVLCAPFNLDEVNKIQPEQILEVIPMLRNIFTYTIIDCGGQLFGCNQAAFESSDHILFVTLLNLPALKNAKRYLATMNEEGFGDDKVKLIINRHIPKDDIRIADAEKVLNAKTYLIVPNAYLDVKSSINKGLALVTCSPRSPYTRAMDDLARRLTLDRTDSGSSVAAN